jgi:hypothetical protein
MQRSPDCPNGVGSCFYWDIREDLSGASTCAAKRPLCKTYNFTEGDLEA